MLSGRGRSNEYNRSNQGRGKYDSGRGFNRPNYSKVVEVSNKGMTPQINAYLDAQPGHSMGPDKVDKWAERIKTYSMTVTVMGVHTIFSSEGKVGEIAKLVEPDEPGKEFLEREIWKIEISQYYKDLVKLKNETKLLFGIMLGQCSDKSISKIKQTDIGREALSELDPQKLLKAIYASHVDDSTLGGEENLYKIVQLHNKLWMGSSQTIDQYYQATISILAALKAAHEAVGNDANQKMPDDIQQAMKFIKGLNEGYVIYKGYYADGLKDWPTTLVNSYDSAVKYVVKPPLINPNHNNHNFNFVTNTRGRNGGRSGGGGGRGNNGGRNKNDYNGYNGNSNYNNGNGNNGNNRNNNDGINNKNNGNGNNNHLNNNNNGYGSRRGVCHTCGIFGHFSRECTASNSNNDTSKDGANKDLDRAVESQKSYGGQSGRVKNDSTNNKKN